GGTAGAGLRRRRRQRRDDLRLRRRGRRGRRVRGRRRGGTDLVTDEHVQQEAQVEHEEQQPDAQDDRLLRLAADFENYKKRAARERQEYVQLANERLIAELIPILDDLERALSAAEEHQEAQLEEGVRLVHRSLAGLLERNGVQAISTEGRFDPH